jgi:hypothetical protein
LEEALEAHARTYIIDGILKALHWVIVPSTPSEIANMIPEAQVDPPGRDRRFLDYFGYERQVDRPLLLVEAKRPSTFPIPPGGSTQTASETVSQWLKDPQNAPPEWKKWLPSLQNYVVSIFERTNTFPIRAAITDGDWLVVFEDPKDAFGAGGTRNPQFVYAFTDKNDVDERYDLVFRLLDQRIVARLTREIAPGEIAGFVAPAKVVRITHGLRLRTLTHRRLEA